MSALQKLLLHACLAVLFVGGALVLPTNHAQATHYFFDVNGATTGSGVTDGGSYTWEGTKWNSNATGVTTSPIAWPEGNNFPEFAAASDAGGANYTVTANSNHTFAGMALQTSGGGTVTLAGGGGVVLSLLSTSAGQGIFVGGANTQKLLLTAAIGGDSITPLV